jgi:hypothetical protein
MKDIQRNMRHLRMSTTADISVQDIPESRRRAIDSLPVPGKLKTNWSVLVGMVECNGSQVIDLMVARDGVEPPTPAFSGLRSTS